MISCGFGALIFTLFFLCELRPVRVAVHFYFAGIFLLVLAGALDYLPKHILQQRLPLGTEELAEYFAGTSFALAFLFYALERSSLALVNWLLSMKTK